MINFELEKRADRLVTTEEDDSFLLKNNLVRLEKRNSFHL